LTLPPTKDLLVWLDAADRDSVKTDPAGRVLRWRDKSPRNADAIQENPARRPGYLTAGIHGKPCITFDETRRTRLELPDLSDKPISATVFVVFSNPRPPSPNNHDQRLFTASDGKGYDYKVGMAATIPGMTTGGPRQAVYQFNDRWARKVRVGCFSPHYQTFFTGMLGEILVYGRLLSEDERDLVRAYLMAKWGLNGHCSRR